MNTGPAASTQKANKENHLSGESKYIGEPSTQGIKRIINVIAQYVSQRGDLFSEALSDKF